MTKPGIECCELSIKTPEEVEEEKEEMASLAAAKLTGLDADQRFLQLPSCFFLLVFCFLNRPPLFQSIFGVFTR